MKTPASIADLGLALWSRLRLARSAALGRRRGGRRSCSTRPSSTSAPGGASTSRSTCCSAMAAVVFAIRGRNGLAAALLAVSLMTKPQALPFLVPFAAWFWATGRVARVRRGRGRRRGRRRGPVAAVHRRRRTRQLPATTSPTTRATSSTSCRCAPGTCGGSSRASSPADRSWPTTWRSSGRSRCACVGYALTGRPVAGRRRRHRARPDAADAHPRAGGGDADRVLLPDLDARALRVRRARLPDAAGPGPDRARAGGRLRDRVHANLLAAAPPTPEIGDAPADPWLARVSLVRVAILGAHASR